jgi:hypothetical protein
MSSSLVAESAAWLLHERLLSKANQFVSLKLVIVSAEQSKAKGLAVSLLTSAQKPSPLLDPKPLISFKN